MLPNLLAGKGRRLQTEVLPPNSAMDHGRTAIGRVAPASLFFLLLGMDGGSPALETRRRKAKQKQQRCPMLLRDWTLWDRDWIAIGRRLGRPSVYTCFVFFMFFYTTSACSAEQDRDQLMAFPPWQEEDLEETVVSIMAAALQAPADGFTIDWPRSPLLLKRGGSLPDSVASAQSRDSRIERFVSQGGFLWGPLEVSPLAPAYWGRRWFAYAFLGRLNGDQLPETIRVSGKRRGQPFNLSAPVARRDGQALHTMAAWHLVESLESFPHSVLGEAHGLPNPEDKQWQSVGVAVCYGIATVKTSWVAIKREATIASQTRTTEDTTLSVGGASSLSVYGLARFGSSVSVLDFAHHGSSMALRSFARLGSTLAVYGLARLGSSPSVLDCVQLGSSMALRSFARMGSSVAILDFLSCGSSLSLRSFCRLGSRFSVLVGSSWSQNISGPSLDLADSPSAESPDLPLKKKAPSNNLDLLTCLKFAKCVVHVFWTAK